MNGVIFVAIAVMWLAYLVPWFAARADHTALADDGEIPSTDSMRFLTDEIDLANPDLAEVSTPFTRKAQLAELRLIASNAAKRRRRVLFTLLAVATALAAVSAFDALPWWAALIPLGLVVVFLGIARFSVVAMHKRLDARADQILASVEEVTNVIKTEQADPAETGSIAVDLSVTEATNPSLLDAIPVTTPTYVSAPLAPRTVRTIDLSSPAPGAELVVPTADAIEESAEPVGLRAPKAVNE